MSYIISQWDLAHSPVLCCIIDIYLMSAIAWNVLHYCSITTSFDWITCRFFVFFVNTRYIIAVKTTYWRKTFQKRNNLAKVRREPEDDDFMNANGRIRGWDKVLCLWHHLSLWAFILDSLGSTFCKALSSLVNTFFFRQSKESSQVVRVAHVRGQQPGTLHLLMAAALWCTGARAGSSGVILYPYSGSQPGAQ